MSGQLTLLPRTASELRRERIPLARIDGFADANPSPKLRELIRDLGLLQPIVVVPASKDRFRIVEGRRRAKAISELSEAGEWVGPPIADALVVGSSDARREEVQGGLTLALHASRSTSPATELRAIENILEKSAEDEPATVKEIAAQTGISVQTVRRRLRLRSLRRRLRDAFDDGSLTASVAEMAARLPTEQQGVLERQLGKGERITLDTVRALARAETSMASSSLPDELFAERDSAWQTTVRGHLVSAIAGIPNGEKHEGLRRALATALAEADRAAY